MGASAVGEVDEGVDGRGSKGETCSKEADNLEWGVSTRVAKKVCVDVRQPGKCVSCQRQLPELCQ